MRVGILGSGPMGGNLGTLAFSRQYKTWGDAPPLAAANRIDLTTTNVSELTVNPYRAKDNCRVDWHVTSDGPLTIHMIGCNRVIHVP